MKRITAVTLLLCVLFSGCSVLSGVDTVTETEAITNEPEIRYILDEDSVHNAFNKAVEVYGWFDLCTLEADYSEPVKVGDKKYYRVLGAEVASYSELRTLVYSLFSVEIGDALLRENDEYPTYIDYNGDLYGLDFARGSDIEKGEYTTQVEYVSNTSILYKVRVELLEFDKNAGIEGYRKVVGYEDHEFRYEYVNNKWVFTSFELFY